MSIEERTTPHPCLCVCGHQHLTTCTHCGCTIYEPDDGTPTPERDIHPPRTNTPYNGRYAQPQHDRKANQ